LSVLYLLRHAKSSWDDPRLADHERPLAPRGRRACARLCAHVAAERIVPTLVICSSAARARETLARIEPALAGPHVEVEDGLYAASAATLLSRLKQIDDDVETVMVVAHNPGLHELALGLARSPGRLAEGFPTGALATLDNPGPWRELVPGSAELLDYVVPRELERGLTTD
jgi:phosphohistidine phosphatase